MILLATDEDTMFCACYFGVMKTYIRQQLTELNSNLHILDFKNRQKYKIIHNAQG